MDERRPKGLGTGPVVALLVALAAVGVALIALDWREVSRLLGRADWWLTGLAILATAVSYAALSCGLVAIARLVGIQVPARVLGQVAFVSNAANHLVSSGGVVGYSLNAALVTRHRAATGDVLAMSVTQSYLNNLALLGLMGTSITWVLAAGPEISIRLRSVMAVSAAVAAIVLIATTTALFAAGVRVVILAAATALLQRIVPRRWRAAAALALDELDTALSRTRNQVRARPLAALAPLLWVAVDWIAVLSAFWCCVAAFGDALPPSLLVAAFTLGVGLGVMSLVPGGLGVQESGQTAILAMLGIQVEHAALATVLFRVVYYFLPFLMSLAFYRSMVRSQPTVSRAP